MIKVVYKREIHLKKGEVSPQIYCVFWYRSPPSFNTTQNSTVYSPQPANEDVV